MEHREPPRIAAAEGRAREPVAEAAGAPPRRFAGFNPPHTVRRLKPHALALVALAALAGLYLLARWVQDFVHDQPVYRTAFRAITLKPDPPAWYRGGKTAFLDRLQAESRLPAAFSVPGLDLGPLRSAIQRDPWVVEVGTVRKEPPNVLVVPLAYREPVAVARFGTELGPAVDAEGVLLPRDQIDLEAAGPLIFLQDFPRPLDPQYGRAWSRADPRHGAPEPDPHVAAAGRLAAFLRQKIRAEPPTTPPLPRVFLHGGERGCYVQIGRDFFYWGDPLDAGKSVNPSDEEKWEMLRQRVRSTPPAPGPPWIYFRFARQGLIEVDRRTGPERGNAG